MWEQFVTDHMAAALRLDSLRSSHPIQVPIHHAEEVEQVFDAICKAYYIITHFDQKLENESFNHNALFFYSLLRHFFF
jgi:puromycin-sensitive aminopeptidase